MSLYENILHFNYFSQMYGEEKIKIFFNDLIQSFHIFKDDKRRGKAESYITKQNKLINVNFYYGEQNKLYHSENII